jgi:hypothetical protein
MSRARIASTYIRQRTQLVNMIRAQLAEFSIVLAKEIQHALTVPGGSLVRIRSVFGAPVLFAGDRGLLRGSAGQS